MEEIWRDIQGYEGQYKVSNFGNVKSLDRVVHKSNGHITNFKSKTISKRSLSGNRPYYFVSLWKNNKEKQLLCHRLVASSFLGYDLTDKSMVVDHIDNDPLNNLVSNLQVITCRENVSKDRVNEVGYTGVQRRKNKSADTFWSIINYNKKPTYIGTFKCELAAAYAYNMKLKEITNG